MYLNFVSIRSAIEGFTNIGLRADQLPVLSLISPETKIITDDKFTNIFLDGIIWIYLW